jgi:hypothetical protein
MKLALRLLLTIEPSLSTGSSTMKRLAPLRSLFLAAAALIAGAAQAGRPLQSEDAGVLARGDCELEGAALRGRDAGLSARETTLQLGCGIGATTQLALALGHAKAAGTSARGIEFNGKSQLWQGQNEAALALAYAVASVKASGASWQHAATEFNLAYTRPLGSALTVHANLGHARDEIGKLRSTTWSLAVEHAGVGAVAPMAELFGDDRSAAWWNAGLRFTAVPERFYIDASYGRQIVSGTPTLWSLGFKFAF